MKIFLFNVITFVVGFTLGILVVDFIHNDGFDWDFWSGGVFAALFIFGGQWYDKRAADRIDRFVNEEDPS